MDADDLCQLRRRFDDEITNERNLDAIPKYMPEDLIDHLEVPGMPPGLPGVRARHEALFTAFPDLHITIDDVIAQGDVVAARFTITGTHDGDLFGIPPTGKAVTVTGMDFMREAGGMFVEHWAVMDMMGLMGQLGVLPG